VWHDSFIRVTWLIYTCDMTHLYVWHDSFIRVTWLIYTCDMTHSYATWLNYMWHDSFIMVTWCTNIYGIPHLSCVTGLIHIWDTTHSYVWHDSFIRVTWLIHTSDMTHSFWWCDALVFVAFHSQRRSDLNFSDLQIRRFSRPLFWVTGTPFTHVKTCLNFWGLLRNVFDMYGDSCENLLDILAVVMICSPISSVCGLIHDVWHDSSICVTWLIHMFDVMTHSDVAQLIRDVWHDTFICVTWLICMCDTMTHSDVAQLIRDVWHDSFKCVTWLVDNVWHDDSFRCGTIYSRCVAWLLHMCDMTHR